MNPIDAAYSLSTMAGYQAIAPQYHSLSSTGSRPQTQAAIVTHTGQQSHQEMMLNEEPFDLPLKYMGCYSAGFDCELHAGLDFDMPSRTSVTALNFSNDVAWMPHDSGAFLASSQTSSSSVHSIDQACTDSPSASTKSSCSSSEDEQSLHRFKPSYHYTAHAHQYPDSVGSWAQTLQSRNESSTGGSVRVNQAHDQFIDPALLAPAHHDIATCEAHPKKRQRTQEDPQMLQAHGNTDADIRSTESIRVSLLDPQTLMEAQSSENQIFLHQLQGIYAEFTSPLNSQNSQTIEGLAALFDRLVKDWMNKPSHVECLKYLDGVPVPPAARDPCSPFACVCGCGYTSPRLCDLERHLSQNWLASYWQCSLCDKRFDRRDMLSAHLRSKKHSEAGETVDKERDFRHNQCDADFTKQCGFCGKVCKGFKVFTRHIGKHFRGTATEAPKGMRDWRDTWDDDDDDSNSDDGKGAGRTGKANNKSDRHDRGGGSNGGKNGSSKGTENDSSKGSNHPSDRGTKRGNNRSRHCSTYNSKGSGFRAFDSSSTDGSLSLSDTALLLSVPHIRERRKAGRLPLRLKKTEKQPQEPPVNESIIENVEAPILTTQNALPHVCGPPWRGPQSSEVIIDAAERWKAFRLKYDSSGLKTQAAKVWKHSHSRSPSEAPPQSRHHKDKSESAGMKVKASVKLNKTTDGLATDHTHTTLEGASQNGSTLNAKRETKQWEPSKHRITDSETVMSEAIRHPLAIVDSFGVSRLLGSNGQPCYANDPGPSFSNGVMSLPGMGQRKNAVRPPFRREETGCTTFQGSTLNSNALTCRTPDSKAQKHDIRRKDALVHRHRDTSWRDWPPVPQLRQAGLKQGFDPRTMRRNEFAPLRQGDSLTELVRLCIPSDLDSIVEWVLQLHLRILASETVNAPDAANLEDQEDVQCHLSRLDALVARFQNVEDRRHYDNIPTSVLIGVRYIEVPGTSMVRYSDPSDLRLNDYPWSILCSHSECPSLAELMNATAAQHRIKLRAFSQDMKDLFDASQDLCDALQCIHSVGGLWQTKSTARAGLEPDMLRGRTKSQRMGYHHYIEPATILWFSTTKAKILFSKINDFRAGKNARQAGEEHKSDMTATRRRSNSPVLHFTIFNTRQRAPFTDSISVLAMKDLKDCYSSSSQEWTSFSQLEQERYRARIRLDYTFHRCFKTFRTTGEWLDHVERCFCSVDNWGSQAQMTKDQKKQSSCTAPNFQGIEHHWLAIYQLLFPTAVPPLSLYLDDPCGDNSSLVSAAYNLHGVPGLEDDGPSHIRGCGVQICQSKFAWSLPGRGGDTCNSKPRSALQSNVIYANMQITQGAPIINALDAVRQMTCKKIAKLWIKKIEPKHGLVLVTPNGKHAESVKGALPGASGVAYRGRISCFGTSGEGSGSVYIFMR